MAIEKIGDILKKKFGERVPVHAKYEFQEYGVRLAETLHDIRHKALYIKLAKEKERSLLERARVFAIDVQSESINRGRLFMWKLTELEKEKKAQKKK
ncbi:MAG: hypothetical protein A2172_02490 [Candidatus Woykebacteria bacterium RBG_13_40_15]|uniref:Uncharacterized protein n=1 Tax=Candidatus Woykebacteria bacterium RBG_13_40_15 TaxID=1802593 RepID=A0A1G1W6K7_9BACT|nr:MAG: hypothetical protein A2172_02490 [Candidatus Woykebacteria bacterium RBG_13_40_15]